MSEQFLKGYLSSVYGRLSVEVWVHLRVYLSVQALYGATNVL